VIGHAEFSEGGEYRWLLTRRWLPDAGEQGYVLWIGLNPSTADAKRDDATIRRLVGYAKRWGFTGIAVANLFSFVATDPKDLYRAEDPIGPDDHGLKRLLAAASGADRVVACWGARTRMASEVDYFGRIHGGRRDIPREHFLAGRASDVCRALGDRELWCLGKTRGGHPRHPVRLGYDVQLERFDGLSRYPPEREMRPFCVCGHGLDDHTIDPTALARETALARSMGASKVMLNEEDIGACSGKVRPMVPWSRDPRWRELQCTCMKFRLPEESDYVKSVHEFDLPAEPVKRPTLTLIQGGAA
jgi:hypothetical protein